jgi:hypothetical protein
MHSGGAQLAQPSIQQPSFQQYIPSYTYTYQLFQHTYQPQFQQPYYPLRPQWPYYPYVDHQGYRPYWYNGTVYPDLGGYQYHSLNNFHQPNPVLSREGPIPPQPSQHIPHQDGPQQTPTVNNNKRWQAPSNNESSHSFANNRSQVRQWLDGPIDLTQIERLVQEGIDKRLADDAGLKSELLNVDDSPLAEIIYAETMSTFNFSTLNNFKGSDDNQDHETFIVEFHEKLRVLGVFDAIMCRLFMVCLCGEAWEWYMRLPKRSINNFGDFIKVFLTCYANLQAPRKFYDSLFEIVQGHKEKNQGICESLY